MPDASQIRAAFLAAGLALAPAAAHAEQGPAQTEEARNLARLMRHDESLQSAGLLGQLPPPHSPSLWPAVASLAVGLAAAGGVTSIAKKHAEGGRETGIRDSLREALGSPYRNVRLDSLTAIAARTDLDQFPIGDFLKVGMDPDHEVAAAARRVIAKHPDAPLPTLRHIGEHETNLNTRADALTQLERRKLP